MPTVPSRTPGNRAGNNQRRVKGCGYEARGLRGMIPFRSFTAPDMIKFLSTLGFAIALPMVSVAADPAWDQEDPTEVWSTWGGAGAVELRADYLPDFGLDVLVGDTARRSRIETNIQVRDLGSLSVHAPAGNFAAFLDGRLDLVTEVVLRHGKREVSLAQLVATPMLTEDHGHPALRLVDARGRHLLTVSYLHIRTDAGTGLLTIRNAGVIVTEKLAELLDLPALAGTPLGMLRLDLNLHVPPGANTSGIPAATRGGSACAGRPFWPQDGNPVDVALIGLDSVDYKSRSGSLIKIAPSATLQNVGFGDAVWVPKFRTLSELTNGSFDYPFNPADQHPFLVWNMYRILDGRIEQIGSSGVKHAFFSVNVNCQSCGTGYVLWPQCQDTYFSGTNDSNSNQGPRADISPAEALFESTGSFFDPGETGGQTNNSTAFQNRLVVEESELQVPGATYFFDSWYVVQADVDIFNTMGYRQVTPTPSGSAWVFPAGPFQQGPAVSAWVDPDATAAGEDHVVVTVPSETPNAAYPENLPRGHLRVLSTVEEVSPGRWRYRYAVMNYDLGDGVDRLELPLPSDANLFDTHFSSPSFDGLVGSPWSVSRSGNSLVFEDPGDNPLNWFSLFNFEMETDAPPQDKGTMSLGTPGPTGAIEVSTRVPLVTRGRFIDGFESSPLP